MNEPHIFVVPVLTLTTPIGLALLGFAAAVLLGFAIVAYRLRRLHRRLRRLDQQVPADLQERLARGEQAYNEMVRLRTGRGGEPRPALRLAADRTTAGGEAGGDDEAGWSQGHG